MNSKPYELVLNKDNVEKYTGCLNAKSAKMQCVSLAEGPTYSAGSTVGVIWFIHSCRIKTEFGVELNCNNRIFFHFHFLSKL